MANISVRNLNDGVAAQIKVRAAQNGRSMEAEARAILTAAVTDQDDETNIALALYEVAQSLGGFDLDLPKRTERPRIMEFE